MQHTKKRKHYIVRSLILALLVFILTACSSHDSEHTEAVKPILYTGAKYYLHGSEKAGFLKFNEDRTVDIEIKHGTMYLYAGTASGEYTEENGLVEIKCDFEWFGDMKLEIVDDYALVMHFEEDILTAADVYFIRFGRSGADYGIDSAGEPIDSQSGDDGQFSILDTPMTPQRAEEIYAAFAKVSASHGDYMHLSDEEATAKCKSYDADAKALMYQQFSGIARKLGLRTKRSEAEWIQDMDVYKSGTLFYRALLSLDADNDNDLPYLQSVYSYQKGLKSGKYAPLDDRILAVADNLTIEYYTGSYLLCTGGDHIIQQMTYDWTVEEASFNASGSITAVKTDDIFKDESVSYYISGENGVFSTVEFGSTDFLPILRGIGAIDKNGAFLTQQINICAVNVFDAGTLFVLSQEESGIITIAVVEYDRSQGKYVWNGETYISRSRCCFNRDNEFTYADIEGDDILRLGKARAEGE